MRRFLQILLSLYILILGIFIPFYLTFMQLNILNINVFTLLCVYASIIFGFVIYKYNTYMLIHEIGHLISILFIKTLFYTRVPLKPKLSYTVNTTENTRTFSLTTAIDRLLYDDLGIKKFCKFLIRWYAISGVLFSSFFIAVLLCVSSQNLRILLYPVSVLNAIFEIRYLFNTKKDNKDLDIILKPSLIRHTF